MLAKDRFGGVKNGKFINAGFRQKANLVLGRRTHKEEVEKKEEKTKLFNRFRHQIIGNKNQTLQK